MKPEQIKAQVMKKYRERTTNSAMHNKRAENHLPGGDTRSIGYYRPYPIFGTKGGGCHLYDCDGNHYIDFVNNMTALVNGHGHPHVVEAIRNQLEKGTAHGVPFEVMYKLAEHICRRVPSIESLRFCNSGSEATLFAMRAARAFSGKQLFIKMDGGYHGCHEHVQVNVSPDLNAADRPIPYAKKEIPASVIGDMLVAPFNDLDTVDALLKENPGAVAAILVEPILGAGGLVPPAPGFLRGLRELADTHDALLIFDEIITFRVHEGGYQALENILPDITALGKSIGGGLPVGAFGGRKDIMAIFNPKNPDAVTHSGTFSGNAITMAAGLANLEIFRQKEIDRLNALGERFTEKMNRKIKAAGLTGRYEGFPGALGMLRFTDLPVTNSKEAMTAAASYKEFQETLHLEMMNRGVFFLTRGMFTLSTPMAEKEIDETVSIFGRVLEFLKPMAPGN